LLVEADGEIIGTTPISVKSIPKAVNIVVPETTRLLTQTLENLIVVRHKQPMPKD
jgi:hypothetical protein